MKKIILSILFLLIFSLALFGGYNVLKNKVEINKQSQLMGTKPISDDEQIGNAVDDTNSLSSLNEKIKKELKEYDGEWSVYVENLENGDAIEINNKKMVSASLIKLFIMGEIYEEIEKGTIKKENVASSLASMITVSDNEASNVLVATLGGGEYRDMYTDIFQEGLKKVNDYANSLQCADTCQERDMKNSRVTPIPEQNYTSVVDCGKFLSRLYHKKLVSNAADLEMLELLKQQKRTEKIPKGLPDGTICANKTGELSNVENDVAIVYSPGTDYVICVMSNEVPDTSIARKNIIYISQMVYNFFNR